MITVKLGMNDPFASKYLWLLLERGFTIRSLEVQTEYNAKFDLGVEKKKYKT